MFDFWKQFVKGDEIKKISSGSGVSYVASKKLKKEINEWNKDGYLRDVDFSLILYNLGFEKNRILYFERVPDENNISIRYGYDKEIDGDNVIDLCVYDIEPGIGRYKPFDKKIILSGDDYRKVYICLKNIHYGLELKLVEDIVNKKIDDSIYERILDVDKGLKISFKNMKNIYYNVGDLTVKDVYYDEIIIKAMGKFDGLIKIENEDMLIDYLSSITEDEKIEDIYKKICEISLGNDDAYHKIEIVFKKLDKEEARFSYRDGKFDFLTRYGKEYCVSDGDRNYTYKYIEKDSYVVSKYKCYEYIISKGDYNFVLTVKPLNFTMNNSVVIMNYLCNLELPISISEVYKKICEIFLFDINEYEFLEFTCYRGEKMVKFDYKASLCIENGKFNSYRMLDDRLDVKLSSDGKFSYVNKYFDKEIVVYMNGDVVTNCHFSSENGIESENMGNSIYDGINDAKDYKVRTKKMIDNLIGRDNR